MCCARRLLMLGAMTLITVAMFAGTASGQTFEVTSETEEECGEVVPIGAHGVEGGCHVESEGNITLWAHLPAETPITQCHFANESFIGSNGSGYITQADMTASTVPPFAQCVRQACDEGPEAESPHMMLRWPATLVENGPGDEILETTFCLRSGNGSNPAQEGGSGAWCEVHLRSISNAPTHENDIGQNGVHKFCEVAPFPFPISVTGTLTNGTAADGENVEIVHNDP